ncbi:MAG: vWA domain-containing protein [Candidatus Paceibacterota bacterium]
MKKIVTSLGMIVFAVALVASGTGAFFSDTETSTGNVFTAGALDLKVDSVAHINGLVCFDGAWTDEDIIEWVPEEGDTPAHLALKDGEDIDTANTAYNTANPANVPQAGDACAGTWSLTDLEDGVHTFFDFEDVKPGDNGENTISLHVENNDAWMCVDVDITKNDDVSSTEPELESGDVAEDNNDDFDGELAQNMTFFAWADDGDNIWETGEPKLFSNVSGPASDVLGGRTYTLADSTTGTPFPGATTQYIGLAWCAGTIDASIEGTVTCDGSTMKNEAQTDSMTADIAFRVEQARNNPNFVCDERDGGLACNEENDVVFVLDSSGSISPAELGVMSTAAKAFASALAPATPGNHIGVVDFDFGATLNSQLTDVLADINTAIDALSSGGTTNLAAGISLASTELSGVRDRDDVLEAPDFMLIMTDGVPDDEGTAVIAANAAKAAGTTIYVVGIGDGVNNTFLEGIATSPAHYFTAAEFSDLENILAGLADCPIN